MIYIATSNHYLLFIIILIIIIILVIIVIIIFIIITVIVIYFNNYYYYCCCYHYLLLSVQSSLLSLLLRILLLSLQSKVFSKSIHNSKSVQKPIQLGFVFVFVFWRDCNGNKGSQLFCVIPAITPVCFWFNKNFRFSLFIYLGVICCNYIL